MTLNKYEVFVRVAELGNLTRVAAEMNYTQSAISHSIQSLESEIGIPLIHRTKNGVSLTQYGEELLPDFRRITTSEEILFQKAAQFNELQRGKLKIAAFTSISMHWMPPIAKAMAENYPGIQLIQQHYAYDGVIEHLTDGTADVGFLTETSKCALDFIPLYEDEYLVVLPPDHRLAHYERIPIEALENEKFVLMDEGGEYDSKKIFNQIPNGNVIHWVNEDFLAMPLVEQGIGVSILPSLICDCVRTHAVIKRFAEPRTRMIGMAAKSFKDAPPLVTLFSEQLNDFLKDWSPQPLYIDMVVNNNNK